MFKRYMIVINIIEKKFPHQSPELNGGLNWCMVNVEYERRNCRFWIEGRDVQFADFVACSNRTTRN